MSKSLASKPGASARTITLSSWSSTSTPQKGCRPHQSASMVEGQGPKKRSKRASNSRRKRFSGEACAVVNAPGPAFSAFFHGVKLNMDNLLLLIQAAGRPREREPFRLMAAKGVPAGCVAPFPNLLTLDGDSPGLDCFCLGQMQGQDAVLELGADLARVDAFIEREGAIEVAHAVLAQSIRRLLLA